MFHCSEKRYFYSENTKNMPHCSEKFILLWKYGQYVSLQWNIHFTVKLLKICFWIHCSEKYMTCTFSLKIRKIYFTTVNIILFCYENTENENTHLISSIFTNISFLHGTYIKIKILTGITFIATIYLLFVSIKIAHQNQYIMICNVHNVYIL